MFQAIQQTTNNGTDIQRHGLTRPLGGRKVRTSMLGNVARGAKVPIARAETAQGKKDKLSDSEPVSIITRPGTFPMPLRGFQSLAVQDRERPLASQKSKTFRRSLNFQNLQGSDACTFVQVLVRCSDILCLLVRQDDSFVGCGRLLRKHEACLRVDLMRHDQAKINRTSVRSQIVSVSRRSFCAILTLHFCVRLRSSHPTSCLW